MDIICYEARETLNDQIFNATFWHLERHTKVLLPWLDYLLELIIKMTGITHIEKS